MRSCVARQGWPQHSPLPWLLVSALIIGFCWAASELPSAAAAAPPSIQVDPVNGDDANCNVTLICQTIAFAVHFVGVSQLNLSSGIFCEDTIDISNVRSLVISGVPSATRFDCSRRQGRRSRAAFTIFNSTITFTGITFHSCFNDNGRGGALSANNSSVEVLQCQFINCSAASGGAVWASGLGRDQFLHIHNSNFSGNNATGDLIGCANGESSEPCSTWGGAVAALDIIDVNVTGCTMVKNQAEATVPRHKKSDIALAGGGCVSVRFSGNSSGSTLHFSGNTFSNCTLKLSKHKRIGLGNGTVHCRLIVCFTSAARI